MQFRHSTCIGVSAILLGSLALVRPAYAHAGHNPTAAGPAHPTSAVSLTVYKNPGCGCCDQWIALAKADGFKLTIREPEDMTATKRKLGVPLPQSSCHTATAEGYFFEGHVPFDLIRKVLETRPAVMGLLVPGMPASAPGMDDGGPHQPYEILALGKDGQLTRYARR